MKKVNIKFKDYYDGSIFQIEIIDEVNIKDYKFINFSGEKSSEAIFNFYKNNMMQGQKITDRNLGYRFINSTGFFENGWKTWKAFKEEWNKIILYKYDIVDEYLIIEPTNIKFNDEIFKNNNVLHV